MSTPPKPNITLTAKFLGPIFSLEEELSRADQNLIFARNGTGKSFLARALRILEGNRSNDERWAIAKDIPSEESEDGTGWFEVKQGDKIIGNLSIDSNSKSVELEKSFIFHVFSEEFVQAELRERKFEADGEIEKQIIVDSDNIAVNEKEGSLKEAEKKYNQKLDELETRFEKERLDKLNDKASIKKNVNEYRALSFSSTLKKFVEKPANSSTTLKNIYDDLDAIRSIPSEPDHPTKSTRVEIGHIDLDDLVTLLLQQTPQSTISDAFRDKLSKHPKFFQSGINIYSEEAGETCPFCEQSVANGHPADVIAAYIEYFEAAEEKHKSELREFYRKFSDLKHGIERLQTSFSTQLVKFNVLKELVPSQREAKLNDLTGTSKIVLDEIKCIQDLLTKKSSSLEDKMNIDVSPFIGSMELLNSTLDKNDSLVDSLKDAVDRSQSERLQLQKKACGVFEVEFFTAHWTEIEKLSALLIDMEEADAAHKQALAANPSADAKERVAETFEHLLAEFFGKKYSFDRTTFKLKREDREMQRGAHKTLSDGEKTAIAFCYYIACIHRQIESDSDYENIYLIIDDPVTSMSYDYVYAIAQALKNLSLTKKGEISVRPKKVDGGNRFRPRMILLTHSSYFYNICLTNKVVRKNAAFEMRAVNGKHRLTQQGNYVAPFHDQLLDIYNVARSGASPDHSTGNTVRAVLEALGRFCFPDKSESLQDFVEYLANETDISIKSMLLHAMSHGSYYDETPTHEDLKQACEETIQVVEKFAPGQIAVVRMAGSDD